jgi:hypothetical protein
MGPCPHQPFPLQDRSGFDVSSASCTVTGSSVSATFSRPVANGDYTLVADGSTVVAWAVGYDFASYTGHGARGVASVDMATGAVTSVARKPLHVAHGVLNYVAWGALLPTGVFLARYTKALPAQNVRGAQRFFLCDNMECVCACVCGPPGGREWCVSVAARCQWAAFRCLGCACGYILCCLIEFVRQGAPIWFRLHRMLQSIGLVLTLVALVRPTQRVRCTLPPIMIPAHWQAGVTVVLPLPPFPPSPCRAFFRCLLSRWSRKTGSLISVPFMVDWAWRSPCLGCCSH